MFRRGFGMWAATSPGTSTCCTNSLAEAGAPELQIGH